MFAPISELSSIIKFQFVIFIVSSSYLGLLRNRLKTVNDLFFEDTYFTLPFLSTSVGKVEMLLLHSFDIKGSAQRNADPCFQIGTGSGLSNRTQIPNSDHEFQVRIQMESVKLIFLCINSFSSIYFVCRLREKT